MVILVVALLETMWDWEQMTSGAGYRSAPKAFVINPRNHSGKRLYSLIGGIDETGGIRLLVTNACKELVTGPNQHGVGDPQWVRRNLETLQPHLLLVCGAVAQKTFSSCGYKGPTCTLKIKHPANRTWTQSELQQTRELIQRVLYRLAPTRSV